MQVEKSRSRRAGIRKNRPDSDWIDWQGMSERGVPASLVIAAVFFALATCILMLRQNVVPYRPGQWLHHNIVSRVSFTFSDPAQLDKERVAASNRQLRVYSKTTDDVWADVERELLQLPDRIMAAPPGELPPDLKGIFDGGAVTELRKIASAENRDRYTRRVTDYIQELRTHRVPVAGREWPIVILPEDQRRDDKKMHRAVHIDQEGDLDAASTYTLTGTELRNLLIDAALKQFSLALQPKIVNFTLTKLQPTHHLDEGATAEVRKRAAEEVPASAGAVTYGPDEVLVFSSESTGRPLDEPGWQLLRAEHHAYIGSLKHYRWMSRLGVAGLVLGITCGLCCYIAAYQTRVISNHPRAIAIAGLLLAMLLLNQIAAIGTGPLYLFGTAPTLLVAMIMAIGYDQRTAIAIGGLHGLLATIALDQGIAFFIVIWVGVMTACFLLDDIRTRSKLIEVGGATALAMAFVTGGAGLLAFDPWDYIQQNCLYAGASGLTVGFIVLGILPFVEKAFRITTSMTLLELADPSQPLLRRLSMEADGTYNHSLQVGVLAEAAAEAIGANALLCRVASYYHDIGKINKPEYFIENQAGRENRHMHLTPNVSKLIIVGHVKDGVELAKEYNLPASIIPFIQQHHGTTLVEYFYRQACNQQDKLDPDGPEVEDHQYRYPGPRPKSKEVALVMLADCVESASRTLDDPTASRVESLVHALSMKRLLDHQFDECDLTMRELEIVERSMIKMILGIYHGRIAYPPEPVEEPPQRIDPPQSSGAVTA